MSTSLLGVHGWHADFIYYIKRRWPDQYRVCTTLTIPAVKNFPCTVPSTCHDTWAHTTFNITNLGLRVRALPDMACPACNEAYTLTRSGRGLNVTSTIEGLAVCLLCAGHLPWNYTTLPWRVPTH